MPKFDAGVLADTLDYDFTTLKDWPKSLSNAKGVIREPSDEMIGDFLESMKNLYTDAKDTGIQELADLGDDPDPMVVMAALDNVTGDDFVKMMNRLSEMYATLCSGAPSLEAIKAVPLRVRLKFFQWLMSEVVRPEGETSGGAQVMNLPQRAATG